ncbi:DUF5694 domain-containing protein [Haloflavibacter putidus]|uniref:TraB/GumN family protein n=1 Tax=Haloflavibacter putidus TaxID=2576776 RepID=A0A507ZRY0_9FLAO|nr:DUF5694 domain-containing protein [Haloflavibacter putidus]TQD40556.1 hypothetical protein FKR84_00840 [Haloflavibacter putidus]
MKFILIPFLICCSLSQAIAQTTFKDPDVFLRKGEQVPQVLLVGSFHFNYPGLDAHKTTEEDKINIYSKKRQLELQELLDYISKFNPTKIMVEAGKNTGYLFANYKAYKNGTEKLRASETSQIGMRLVNRFNLDTIYGVDAPSLLYELQLKKDTSSPETYIDTITKRHYFGGEDKISKRYYKYYRYKDQVEVNTTLLQSFKYMNSEKALNRGFGAYIAGGQFTSDANEGPDALSMLWLNRNLRIFRNIQKIENTKNDRILVLFGAGHVPILKWLFECTPEYELVEFNNL